MKFMMSQMMKLIIIKIAKKIILKFCLLIDLLSIQQMEHERCSLFNGKYNNVK